MSWTFNCAFYRDAPDTDLTGYPANLKAGYPAQHKS
jgi:hypothetical protein